MLRFAGLFLLRFATRVFSALVFHPPPRTTRRFMTALPLRHTTLADQQENLNTSRRVPGEPDASLVYQERCTSAQ